MRRLLILSIIAITTAILTVCGAETSALRVNHQPQEIVTVERDDSLAAALKAYPTVGRIQWRRDYERESYQSPDWKRVRDRVCHAPALFYTGRTNEGPCQVDHLLSVSEAHHRGAREWTRAERRAFFTDETNLVASAPEINREKENRTPAQVGANPDHTWDSPGDDCEYVSRWTRTILAYRLDLTHAERERVVEFLSTCR